MIINDLNYFDFDDPGQVKTAIRPPRQRVVIRGKYQTVRIFGVYSKLSGSVSMERMAVRAL
jgi:hypothetical protein